MMLASQTNIIRRQTHLYFQGGNILQAGDYVIIGLDYLKENCGRMFLETMPKVKKQFENLLGKPVITVGHRDIIEHKHRQYLGGGIFQPIFHIDMYVTPTGKTGKTGKEIVLVGSPRLARRILGEKDLDNDYNEYFDETAEQLLQYFEVQRLPLLPTKYKSKEQEMPRHYYLTYNNALIENYSENGKDQSCVYVATYREDVQKFKSETFILELLPVTKKNTGNLMRPPARSGATWASKLSVWMVWRTWL